MYMEYRQISSGTELFTVYWGGVVRARRFKLKSSVDELE